jgi:hypothetical protein
LVELTGYQRTECAILLRSENLKRIDKSWVVFTSIENDEHNRCVDIFFRPDRSVGFEEFRRDVEDAGAWTPTAFYSGLEFETLELAYAAAEKSVQWLAAIMASNPQLRRIPISG